MEYEGGCSSGAGLQRECGNLRNMHGVTSSDYIRYILAPEAGGMTVKEDGAMIIDIVAKCLNKTPAAPDQTGPGV